MGVIDKGILKETTICPFGSTLFQFPLSIFGGRFWLRECFTDTNCAVHLRVQFRLQMQMGFTGTRGSETGTPREVHEHNYGDYQIIFHILKTLKYILKIKRNLKIKLSD